MFSSSPPKQLIQTSQEPLLTDLSASSCFRIYCLGSSTFSPSMMIRLTPETTVIKTCDAASDDIGPWIQKHEFRTKPEHFESLHSTISKIMELDQSQVSEIGKMDGVRFVVEWKLENDYSTVILNKSKEIFEMIGAIAP